MSAREKAVEVLADCEHASWARWHKYVGECADGLPNGPWTLAFYHVNHWNRQANTDYADLSEQEKESDRKEVQLALDALHAADLVIVNRADVEGALDAMQYVKDTYFWDKHGYQATEDSLRGSLGDD